MRRKKKKNHLNKGNAFFQSKEPTHTHTKNKTGEHIQIKHRNFALKLLTKLRQVDGTLFGLELKDENRKQYHRKMFGRLGGSNSKLNIYAHIIRKACCRYEITRGHLRWNYMK